MTGKARRGENPCLGSGRLEVAVVGLVLSHTPLAPKRIVFLKPPSIKPQITLPGKSKWITFYVGWMEFILGDGSKMKYHMEVRVPFYWALTMCLKGAGLCMCYIVESSQLLCEVGLLPWGSERGSHLFRVTKWDSDLMPVEPRICAFKCCASNFSHLSYFASAGRICSICIPPVLLLPWYFSLSCLIFLLSFIFKGNLITSQHMKKWDSLSLNIKVYIKVIHPTLCHLING